jgi:bacterioferritin-associated ferredoxin
MDKDLSMYTLDTWTSQLIKMLRRPEMLQSLDIVYTPIWEGACTPGVWEHVGDVPPPPAPPPRQQARESKQTDLGDSSDSEDLSQSSDSTPIHPNPWMWLASLKHLWIGGYRVPSTVNAPEMIASLHLVQKQRKSLQSMHFICAPASFKSGQLDFAVDSGCGLGDRFAMNVLEENQSWQEIATDPETRNRSIITHEFKHRKPLEMLSLGYCYRVTDKSILHVAKAYANQLRQLDLVNCVGITDSSLALLVERMAIRLESLNVLGCTNLHGTYLDAVSKYSRNLKKLVFTTTTTGGSPIQTVDLVVLEVVSRLFSTLPESLTVLAWHHCAANPMIDDKTMQCTIGGINRAWNGARALRDLTLWHEPRVLSENSVSGPNLVHLISKSLLSAPQLQTVRLIDSINMSNRARLFSKRSRVAWEIM